MLQLRGCRPIIRPETRTQVKWQRELVACQIFAFRIMQVFRQWRKNLKDDREMQIEVAFGAPITAHFVACGSNLENLSRLGDDAVIVSVSLC